MYIFIIAPLAISAALILIVGWNVFRDNNNLNFVLVDISEHHLYMRSLEILRSCRTRGQYECAERWQALAIKKIKRGEV